MSQSIEFYDSKLEFKVSLDIDTLSSKNDILKSFYNLYGKEIDETKYYGILLYQNPQTYLSDLVLSNLFIKDLNDKLGSNLTMFWGVPKKPDVAPVYENENIEHLIRVNEQYPNELWSTSLKKHLFKDLSLEDHKEITTDKSSGITLFGITKEDIDGKEVFNISQVHYQSILNPEHFPNVNEYASELLNQFSLISENIKVLDSSEFTDKMKDSGTLIIKLTGRIALWLIKRWADNEF